MFVLRLGVYRRRFQEHSVFIKTVMMITGNECKSEQVAKVLERDQIHIKNPSNRDKGKLITFGVSA